MLHELHPVFGQFVDVWRLEFGLPVTTQIAISEVIGQNVYNVGLFGLGADRNQSDHDT